MFKDMPVILVDSYQDINEDLLNFEVNNNLERLDKKYWIDKIC